MRKTVFLLCLALLAGCSPRYTFSLDEHLGICGSKWVDAAQTAGLNYLEANVSSFLMPEKSDEEFAANKALALSSPLPFYSANGFFPREIKIVGRALCGDRLPPCVGDRNEDPGPRERRFPENSGRVQPRRG